MSAEPSVTLTMNDETKKFLEHWKKLAIVGPHGRVFDLKDYVKDVTKNPDGTVMIDWISGDKVSVKIENRVAWVLFTKNIQLPCFTVAGISFNLI